MFSLRLAWQPVHSSCSLAWLIQRRLLIHYPYPGMLGGFGVGGAVRHLADGAVVAVCAVSAIRPSRELVSLNVVAVACLALLIVIAGIQIQVRLTRVVMLVVCIQSNAVIRIGVGENGQIGGVVCIQLILWNGDGDGKAEVAVGIPLMVTVNVPW